MSESLENIRAELAKIGASARRAALLLGGVAPEVKVNALNLMAERIDAARAGLHEANGRDLAAARANGLPEPKVDRLTMTDGRIDTMIEGLRTVAAQRDPVGRVLEERVRPNGLHITKVSVPFGVVGIIYESRPNVTVDAAGIALKAGNAVILRGGSDAIESNKFLASLLNDAAVAAGLPDGVVQLLPWTDREAVKLMLKMNDCISLIGKVDNVGSYLENSSLFALSSLSEGFCLVIIEAMASGLPVVSYDCPCGPKDIIVEGENGYLVPVGNETLLADRICYLIENDDDRNRMGKLAIKNTERFSIDSIMDNWLALFNDLLSKKSQNR